MSKIIKTYIKSSPDELDIYCIKQTIDESLEDLKLKIFERRPALADLNPAVYWIDSEGDKINIVCDEDFKFFMEENACVKLIFNFIGTRKRSGSVEGDIISEYTKKVRKQLESIEISSDESLVMDTDSEDESERFKNTPQKTKEISVSTSTNSISTSEKSTQSSSTTTDDNTVILKVMRDSCCDPIPSTSSGAQCNAEVPTPEAFSYESLNSMLGQVADSISFPESSIESKNEENTSKVRIIDVEVIKPTKEIGVTAKPSQADIDNGNVESTEISGDKSNEMEVEYAQTSTNEPGTSASKSKHQKIKSSNRILISDSSDEETENHININGNNNNNNSDHANANANDANNNTQNQNNFSSAYAYTNIAGDRFETGTGASSGGGRHGRRRHCFRSRSHRSNSERFEQPNFHEQWRSFSRAHSDNMDRLNENIRITSEHVGRTFATTASIFPDLVSTFRSHFVRPLFGNGVHQQFFESNANHH